VASGSRSTAGGDVRVIIVPNDEMQTPHYSVLRVRKGEETSTLSYLLPKLHEEEMALPGDDEPAERKRPEQPAHRRFERHGGAIRYELAFVGYGV
ncbi:hypothetical protein, partial [Klebsiella pneumoniae]|uniref:hypothetical protein n=1 Tax=Klebsiella pneumoniae TaxID=573 RepID=UPI00359C62F0